MLRRAALAFLTVLFLVPGNLMAGAVKGPASNCEDQGCGCPAPDHDESAPSWTERCCCEAQPVPTPIDWPTDPRQVPNEGFAPSLVPPVAASELPGEPLACDWTDPRPACAAQAPPDSLFLRYHNLRL